MKVQSSRTFVGIFMIMLMVFVPFSTTIHPAVAATPTGVIVPLYSYPGNYWTQLIQAKNAHPSVPVIAIINPSSGSGSASDSNYVTGIKNLQSAGITVLGYVYTSYAARSITAAEADINSYKTWYNVNGIMFDEMSNVPGNENYYSTLTQYVKSHGMTMTVGNPGASTLASYVGTVDNITIYEGSGVPTASTLSTRIFSPTYPSSDFSMVSFGVSTLDTTAEKNASPYVSYLYITNDVLSNPYDTVPPYIGNEVAALDTATATASQPPTGVTTTAVSSSQINLSWIAPVNNGGSAILGYKIERSIDSGTTWTTIVSNTASTTTTYSDTGLFPNTSYTYRVSAINSIGTSSPSSMSSTTTSSATSVPSSPAVLTAKTASSSQINLSWTAPTNNGGSAITNYNIYRSTSSGTETFLVRIGNVLSYSDTGLSSGTTYFYKVTAVNSAGESTQSNEATTSLTTPTTNTSNDLATRLGGINTGIYYPMYSLSELPQVLAAKQAFPNVPFNVNINPASGPGTAPSTSWASAITQLKSAGAVVTGYVPTGYGTRTVANVEGMISSYNQFYPNMLDGIMFDEVSGSCSEFTFYQSISNYAKSIGYNYIRANPGSSICQTDVPLFNHIAIFESAGYPSESTLASNTFYPQYPKDVVGFGATIHTTPTYDPTWLHMATKYLKWVYITDQTEPNPYAVFPSYFNQYLTDLSSLAVTTTPPPSPTSPGSPTSLTATAASSSQINLSWTAPTSNGGSAITGYKIERSTDSGTTWSTSIANTASTATTYSDTGLVASTAYKHRVSAINSVGTSSPSTTSSATTMSGSTTTIPQPPTGLTGSAVSSSQINLSWTAPTSNGGSAITGYKIERSTDSGTTWSTIVANTANTAITYSDTGLAASSTYTYRVSAINSIGTSSPSNTASTTTSGTSTTQVAISVNSVDLSGKPITGMWIELHNSSGKILQTGYTPITINEPSGILYTVVAANYQTTIFNHWNDGTTGNSKTITPTQNTVLTAYYSTASVTTVSTTPTSLTATAASSSQINLSWTAPTSNGGSAITGYKIERSTDSGTTWSTIVANTANTAITYSDTGLASSTTYTYRVSAINSVGTSSPSNTISATTISTPTPTTTTQVAISVNSVDLSGKPITGMSTVIRYTNGTTITEGFTPISFTVTSGTTYVVHVRDYGNNVFNHWSDGTTNSYFTITPTQNTVLTAYYSTASVTTVPTSLTATAASSQINLSWTAPTSNGGSAITGYKIERSTDSGTTWSTIVANTANTAITYSDTGLAASSTYTYRVSAINSIGTSSPSNTASATTASTQLSLTIKSVDMSGNPITGMSTVIRYANGTTIAEGFTPISFTVTSGTTYVVHVRDYLTTVFNHWSDGTTNSYFTITPTQNTVLTAYYSTG